jgi:hypothetical protein
MKTIQIQKVIVNQHLVKHRCFQEYLEDLTEYIHIVYHSMYFPYQKR